MPFFDYQCEACGHIFEELEKMGAAPLVDCPVCSKPELQKLLSSPNFHLKGGGWRDSREPIPKKRPKITHTFDSDVPHGDHLADAGHSHGHSHSHDHGPEKKKSEKKSHDHGGHSHSHGHKHDHGHKH